MSRCTHNIKKLSYNTNMLVLLVLSVIIFQYTYGTNVVITNFSQCGQPMQYVNFDCNTPKSGIQTCNILYRSPVENGENFRLDASVEMLRGKKWRKLFTIREEKGVCKALELYLKQLFYEALEIAKEPKQCPLKKGTIQLKNLAIDFSNLQIIIIPKGRLRLHGKTYEKNTGKLGICVDFEAESL